MVDTGIHAALAKSEEQCDGVFGRSNRLVGPQAEGEKSKWIYISDWQNIRPQ